MLEDLRQSQPLDAHGPTGNRKRLDFRPRSAGACLVRSAWDPSPRAPPDPGRSGRWPAGTAGRAGGTARIPCHGASYRLWACTPVILSCPRSQPTIARDASPAAPPQERRRSFLAERGRPYRRSMSSPAGPLFATLAASGLGTLSPTRGIAGGRDAPARAGARGGLASGGGGIDLLHGPPSLALPLHPETGERARD